MPRATPCHAMAWHCQCQLPSQSHARVRFTVRRPGLRCRLRNLPPPVPPVRCVCASRVGTHPPVHHHHPLQSQRASERGPWPSPSINTRPPASQFPLLSPFPSASADGQANATAPAIRTSPPLPSLPDSPGRQRGKSPAGFLCMFIYVTRPGRNKTPGRAHAKIAAPTPLASAQTTARLLLV